jgi:hypothetical protein
MLSLGMMGGSLSATAAQLGLPRYMGAGCPQGTASAVLSPDSSALTIIFDQFIAEGTGGSVGGVRGRTIAKTFASRCKLEVPILTGQNERLKSMKLDYRGFIDLPNGASGSSVIQYSVPGRRPVSFNRRTGSSDALYNRTIIKNFLGPLTDNYIVETDAAQSLGDVLIGCGRIMPITIDTNIQITNPSMISIDSVDGIVAPMKFNLEWNECRS